MKNVKTQKCENGQNAKMVKRSKRKQILNDQNAKL